MNSKLVCSILLVLFVCVTVSVEAGTTDNVAVWKAKLLGKKIVPGAVNNPKREYSELDLPQPYRIIRPGQAVTMDFRPDRLNVNVNDYSIVTEVTYG